MHKPDAGLRTSSACVHVILDERPSPTHPLGDAVETFIRREDAEQIINKMRGDDPELAELPACESFCIGRALEEMAGRG